MERNNADYIREVAHLTFSMGRLQETAYVIARESVEVARLKAEQSRRALMDHRQEHGC
jgi:hypothetical protein